MKINMKNKKKKKKKLCPLDHQTLDQGGENLQLEEKAFVDVVFTLSSEYKVTEDEKDEAKDDQDPACNGYRFICCLEGTLSIARNG